MTRGETHDARRPPPGVRIRRAREADAAAIARIYTQGIEDRVATFETRTRTPDEMRASIASAGERHPQLVAEDPSAGVVAWAAVTPYRSRECYAGIGEFSIYVERSWRGRGIGRPLLEALIEAGGEAGFWKLLSRIFPENETSLRLCRACGFREVGVYEKHAQLDGAWRDVVIVERLISERVL